MESDEESAASSRTNSTSESENINSESEEEADPIRDQQPVHNVFKAMDDLFGASYYRSLAEQTGPEYFTTIAYRDAGWIHSPGRSTSPDNVIISQILSKLDFADLNTLNSETGESILHLAAKYDRAGQNGDCFCGRDGHFLPPEDKNIVSWLVTNPDFVHVGARTKTEGQTALHSAIGAKLPSLLTSAMTFTSENHGGKLGRSFVAHGSLQTMLAHDEVSKYLINVPDIDGNSPLMLAMSLATSRREQLTCLRAADRKPISGKIDLCLRRYFSDYTEAIETLMKSKYLRLHGLFGVTERAAIASSTDTPDTPTVSSPLLEAQSSRQLCYYLKEPHRGLCVFADFCAHDRHSPAVKQILSKDAGKLLDEKKAPILATCVAIRWVPSEWVPKRQWFFSPSSIESTEVGTVLRKFYVRHSRQCVGALTRSLAELHYDINDLTLLRIRVKLMQKFSIESNITQQILQFAGYREYVEDRVNRLTRVASVLNNEVAGFFFGGIESCLKRKYGTDSKIWKLVLEFAGYRREMPSIDLLPKSTGGHKRKLVG